MREPERAAAFVPRANRAAGQGAKNVLGTYAEGSRKPQETLCFDSVTPVFGIEHLAFSTQLSAFSNQPVSLPHDAVVHTASAAVMLI
jgi:hypothetical protein